MSEPCDLIEGANSDRYCLTHKCQAVAPTPLCWKARSEKAEAAIQRVRELADRVARYHGDGLPRIKPRDIYRALDGDA